MRSKVTRKQRRPETRSKRPLTLCMDGRGRMPVLAPHFRLADRLPPRVAKGPVKVREGAAPACGWGGRATREGDVFHRIVTAVAGPQRLSLGRAPRRRGRNPALRMTLPPFPREDRRVLAPKGTGSEGGGIIGRLCSGINVSERDSSPLR